MLLLVVLLARTTTDRDVSARAAFNFFMFTMEMSDTGRERRSNALQFRRRQLNGEDNIIVTDLCVFGLFVILFFWIEVIL